MLDKSCSHCDPSQASNLKKRGLRPALLSCTCLSKFLPPVFNKKSRVDVMHTCCAPQKQENLGHLLSWKFVFWFYKQKFSYFLIIQPFFIEQPQSGQGSESETGPIITSFCEKKPNSGGTKTICKNLVPLRLFFVLRSFRPDRSDRPSVPFFRPRTR